MPWGMSAGANKAGWLRHGLLGAAVVQVALASCSGSGRDFGEAAAGQGSSNGGDTSNAAGGAGDAKGGESGSLNGVGDAGHPPSIAGAGAGGSDNVTGTGGEGGVPVGGNPVCPNGSLDDGEECDDDNDAADDGCTDCRVDEGWECADEPSSCSDINECTAKTYDCSFYGTCGNTVGSYTCQCAEGFEGDGKVCRPLPIGAGSISSGGSATCSYSRTAIKCWGVVDGVKQLSATPFLGVTDIAQLAAGGTHWCALTSNGGVSCWGDNTYGQTGDTSQYVKNAAPFLVNGLGDVVQLGSGSIANHSCAVLNSGAAKCWGQGSSGQLGNGLAPAGNSPPVEVKLAGIVQIALGAEHTCALLETKEVKCWGSNSGHQLGDGGTSLSLAPGPVSTLQKDNALVVVGNWHSCVMTNAGAVKCWGTNGSGELGALGPDGATPVTVPLPKPARALGLGAYHSCAILSDHTVSCWGSNTSGQIGTGSKTPSESPNSLNFSPEAPTKIVAGSAHTCVLFASGKASCWGSNKAGQLGYNMAADSPSPVSVVGLM